MYTKEDLRKAFDAGFNFFPEGDRLYDPSEQDEIEKAKNDEFEEFLDTLVNP